MAFEKQAYVYPDAPSSGYEGGIVAQRKANMYPGVQDYAAPNMVSQSTVPLAGAPSPGMPTSGGMPPLPPSLATPTPATPGATPATGGTTPSATPALDYDAAFNNFKDFIGYDFAFDEMMRALNHGYAASGQLQSGAAAKGIAEHAANLAQQGAAFPYLNYLTGQQNMGVTAGGALAGVGTSVGNAAQAGGQNYANSAGNINAGMGNAIGSGAANLMDLYGTAGKNQAQMWNQVGGALGNLGSSFFPTGG